MHQDVSTSSHQYTNASKHQCTMAEGIFASRRQGMPIPSVLLFPLTRSKHECMNQSKAAAWNRDSPLRCPGGEPRATPGGREQDLHLHALETHAEARVPSHKGPNAGKTCGNTCMKPSPRPAMSCVSSFIVPGLHASAQRPYAVAHAGR